MHIKMNIMSNKPRNDEKTVKVNNESKYQVADVKPGEVGVVSFNDYQINTWALKRVREPVVVVEEETTPIPVKEEPAPVKKKAETPKKKPKGTTKLILVKAFIEAAGGPARAALLLGVERTVFTYWLNSKTNIYKTSRAIDYTSLVQLLGDLEKELFIEKVLELCLQRTQELKSKRRRG